MLKRKAQTYSPFVSVKARSNSGLSSMASQTSEQLSSIQLSYKKIIDQARVFFKEHESQQAHLNKLEKELNNCQQQITVIKDYKQKHQCLPKIKNQKNPQHYYSRLLDIRAKRLDQIKQYKDELSRERWQRHASINSLLNLFLDSLDGLKNSTQFLGTMLLSAPLPDEKIRCTRNEKYKPIYATALSIMFFELVMQHYQFSSSYLNQELDDLGINSDYQAQDNFTIELDGINKHQLRESILKPIAIASLLQTIGTHSIEAEALLGEDRYRLLSQLERTELNRINKEKTLEFFRYGLGLPYNRFDNKSERSEFLNKEKSKLKFIIELAINRDKADYELRELIQIPQVYASFMLSTKPEYDYNSIFKAYDLIKSAIQKKHYNHSYAPLFLNLVGRFPIGSGLYFFSEETGEIERAIVSSLCPQKPDEPVCKQITRHHFQSLNQTEVIISKQHNLFFKALNSRRKESVLTESDSNQNKSKDVAWNANEQWDVQIPAITFWRKNGVQKQN